MHDPAQRKQKFDEIKHHLTGRARTGAGPTVGIPSLRPEHVKRAHYYFPPAHKGHANKSTVEESGNSGAESSAPSSQGLRPNPMTRKRPAAEPLLQASSKQPRHQQMAASDITGDSTQCHPTKHSLSSEFDQYHDRVAGSYQKMIHTLHTLASITKDRLVGEQVDLDSLKSQMRDVTVITESVTKLKDSISTIKADMAAHASELITSSNLEGAGQELDAAQAYLHQLTKKNEKTQAAISIATEKVERLKAQLGEYTEYIVFIGHMSRLCEAGPKGLKRVVDALSERGAEFEMLIGEGISGGQVSADRWKWKPTRDAGFRASGHGK
ncbi:hypothetical protein FOMG_14727 [Fusarium oxysporum f. sp. melonis 26406]|uniref:Uncharacterized protein n=1 Tax=Fusarium oxysporum f. sp. melonis 26406 TaxID=1089452 RepID=X0A6J9_FUSOX|nr:hypothetical protein FOMG_14727 [Fusarium oxysporum f. sp. melonis 26406]